MRLTIRTNPCLHLGKCSRQRFSGSSAQEGEIEMCRAQDMDEHQQVYYQPQPHESFLTTPTMLMRTGENCYAEGDRKMINPCKGQNRSNTFLVQKHSVPGSSNISEMENTPLRHCRDALIQDIVMHWACPQPVIAPPTSSGGEFYPYLSKAAHHLLHQGPHGSNVDDLEVVHVDSAIHVNMLPDLPEHAHQGHVGFTSPLRQWSNMSRPVYLGTFTALNPMGSPSKQRLEHIPRILFNI